MTQARPLPPDRMRCRVDIANEQTRPVDLDTLKLAIERVIASSSFQDVTISLAIIDDEKMHALNRQFLNHDYPTDVLSFPLERDAEAATLVGEIIVSADTAHEVAVEYDWPYEHELLLYVIHGALHLVGFDDKSEEKVIEMRKAEEEILASFSVEHRYR